MNIVICSIAIAISWHGKPNNLNLVDIKGQVLADKGSSLLVDFTGTLLSQYSYLQGPALLVPENNCLYLEYKGVSK